MLEPLDSTGFEAYIHHDKEKLSNMNEWCVKTHTASGLVDQCINSRTTAEEATALLLAYVKSHVPGKGRALLAGNSVHADMSFLMHSPWNQVLDWLHYRLLDVSAIKEAVRRWCTYDVLNGVPRKALNHTAKEDILESIEEARYYQSLFAQLRNPPMTAEHSSRPVQGNSRALPVKTDNYGNTVQFSQDKEEAGFSNKRKAAEAGLPTSSNGHTTLAAGLGGVTQGHHGGRIGDAGTLRSDGAGFRTDVP